MAQAKRAKLFDTEVALCAKFLAAIGADWTSYPETAGWDILLVRKPDGFQIGIQAKLKLNADVVTQALEDGGHWRSASPGPDCRAVLVPVCASGGLHRIAAYIGFTIIEVRPNSSSGPIFWPPLPRHKENWGGSDWFECAPTQRHKLPEYIPDVAAGASAPLQLTDWKIQAIKIAVVLEKRGYVLRHDFKAIGLDCRRWIAAENGWLVVSDGRYVAGPRLPDFKAQHPRVYDEIAADAAKWMPLQPLLARASA